MLNIGVRQYAETFEIIAEKAFVDNWFNVIHNLNITKLDLVQLLEAATINQLFSLMVSFTNRSTACVAMGSTPAGCTYSKVNAFLCSIEEKLDQDNKIPEFYKGTLMTRLLR